MARRTKVVAFDQGSDRREIGYYSTPSFVSRFLFERLLKLRPAAKTVLDPCIGCGELTEPFSKAGLKVTGYDIEDRSPNFCDEFHVEDFLEHAGTALGVDLFERSPKESYDIIIANPPYNCHETDYIRRNKTKLISRFGKSTALNMYSLFLRAIIDYSTPGTVLGLVTHDSFLNAVGHRDLRQFILDTCTIRDLHLCPTSLFRDQKADVRTCLLVLEKGRAANHRIRVSNRPATISEFKDTLSCSNFESRSIDEITLGGTQDNSEIVVGVPSEFGALFKGRRLSDVAPCITGISTGNDAKYIMRTKSGGFTTPFYKNPASRQFYSEPDGYITDDYEAVSKAVTNFMFRNKELLTIGGLSCSSMGVRFGAAIRPAGTLCGVNPNVVINGEDKWWLLSYLNSRLCLYLVRGVLIRSNMITAGYAARIPVPEFSADVENDLAILGKAAFENASAGKSINAQKIGIDDKIETALGLSTKVRNMLKEFDDDPVRLS